MMQPLEIHRRYFDLKVILILIFLIITIFTATRSRAQKKLPRHKFLSFDIQGLGAVSLDDFFSKSDHLAAWGIHTSLLYHPAKIDKFYFGNGFIYYNYGIEDYTQSVMMAGSWIMSILSVIIIFFSPV